ncbi:SET domain-containing protein [Crocosphaera chwakensis]|uniref:SET domain-containing protein n=1 Tax=Crocosphaera chwakensis CCY0110 TaxID=391612 RepID=A3ILP4_9CHRO|nr:SET domain-containing protein-lysine N-methyltransferase [Crocosphaera chwakensis]EAZ92695.1 hypothetical protein CY0110_24051 [Crocosphaera chwakensis CCY0110]
MLHPSHELRYINSTIGYGIFATEPIPKGTIVVFSDPLDIKILPKTYARLNEQFREVIESFSYIDREGQGVLSWDNSKYINHSCDSNILLTPYLFSVSIKEIAKNEQITTDYALLQAYLDIYQQGEMSFCHCDSPHCRKGLNIPNVEDYLPLFISSLNDALSLAMKVRQPLLDFMDTKDKYELIKVLENYHDCSKSMSDFLKKRRNNFSRKWSRFLS